MSASEHIAAAAVDAAADPAVAVAVENLAVHYRTAFARPTLKRVLLARRARREVRVVEALRDVTATVGRGEVLGIVGPNGAGKSTLLRAIAGIVPPTAGRVVVRGRVTTLLRTGVGFNRELSGRENVLLGGLAAGLTPAQVRERFDAIVAFAELGEFIDAPLRAYSSGMAGRLGFAIAAHLDPELLLVDEALAAGDEAFRRRCAARMRELVDGEATVLLVSHGLDLVRDLSDRVLWLAAGEVRELGDPAVVVDAYRRASSRS